MARSCALALPLLALALALMLACLRPAGAAPPLAPGANMAGPSSPATVPARWAPLRHTAFKHHQGPEMTGGTSFVQDRAGLIWIGTQSGLVRWDGYRARHYTADATRAGTLPDNFVLSLHLDAGGVLWVGTASAGLARYDAASDSFVGMPIGVAGSAGVGDARISAMANDGAGGLWIGTASGMAHMDASGTFQRPAAGSLPPEEIDSLLYDRSGQLWIGSASGLWRHSGAGFRPQALALPTEDGKAPAIESLFQDSAGRVWIGTRNNGAYLVAAAGAAPQAVHESGATSTIEHERINSIIEADQNEIWLGTEGAAGGIVAFDIKRGTTRRIRHQADVTDSLHDNDIQIMFRERGGMVLVATMLAMSQHDPHPYAVTTVRSTGSDVAGTLSIPSLLVHPDGRVWLAVSGGGIDLIDPLLGLVGQIRPGLETGSGALPQGRVLSLAVAADGSVYIGTRQGLFHSNADGQQVRRVEVPGRASNLPVFALAAHGATLWIGGLDGLWGLAPGAGGKLALLRHESASLGEPGVKTIYPVPNGDVWVGTRTGLARVAAGGPVELVPTHASAADRMAPGYLSSILMDRRGRMWFSSFGAGIVLLERTDSDGRRRFKRIGKKEGLRDSSVNKLLESEDGAIWASTDAGLARIDPDTLALHLLGPAEGVHVSTYWTNAGARGNAGELLFGGLSGLTVLRPADLTQRRYSAPLAVTRLVVNDIDLPAGPMNGAAPATIEIAPHMSERGFSLEFAALDYSAPERNLYSYRLAGFDSAWVSADAAARRIGYNNLQPGSYTLQLRGSNRDGQWSVPLAIPVRVLPAWHQRAWVRGLALLGLVGILAALVQVRTAYLRRRQAELQLMVDERTAELRATQAQLEQLAYADPLTALPNRRMFNDEMRHLAAQALRGAGAFTLVLIDLDHFKQINDTLGHDAGDAVLVTAAQRLRASVREVDRLFRLGGDEFAVLLNQTTDPSLIDMICARVVAGMALPIPYAEVAMQVSASVGAARFDGQSLEALYKTADSALYLSKARGRNTWTLHGRAPAAADTTVS